MTTGGYFLNFLNDYSKTSFRALSEWEQRGFVKWLVTQNVDALHTKAGSKNITELHGCSHRVVCLHCPKVYVFHSQFNRF